MKTNIEKKYKGFHLFLMPGMSKYEKMKIAIASGIYFIIHILINFIPGYIKLGFNNITFFYFLYALLGSLGIAMFMQYILYKKLAWGFTIADGELAAHSAFFIVIASIIILFVRFMF